MRNILYITTILAALHTIPLYSANAEGLSEVTQIKQTIETLQQRIKHLEQKQADAKLRDAIDVVVTLKPAPKFKTKDGAFSAKIIGFGQADTIFHQNNTVDHPDGTTIRRARLGLAGKIYHDWGYKFLYDFGNNNNPQLQDMFITYNGMENGRFIIGQYKEAIGLEWQSAAKYWSFMELPLTTALTPRRAVGAGVRTMFDDIRLDVGIFGENANKTKSDDEGYAFNGHFSYSPIHNKKQHLHVGLSGSYRVPDSASNSIAYGAKHDTSTTKQKTVATDTIKNVDHNMLMGVEFLGIHGPYLLQGEYMQSNVARQYGLDDVSFQSYYLQGSWMITGESRKFNRKKHGFMRVKPNNPFSMKEKGSGAWELAVRTESIDLTDNDIQGGSMDKYTFGINWYPNDYMRFTFNYAMINSDDEAAVAGDNSHVIGIRTRVEF